MQLTDLDIDAVKMIRPRRFTDQRGYFSETWSRKAFADLGLDEDFVQDNCSYSVSAGTIRGLHFQRPPAAQAKLIRVAHGSIFDVAVDLRRSSESFGRAATAVLTAKGGEQLFIPAGFAHGFCTLEPDTLVAYKMSAFYAPAQERGILWSDPSLAIDWPLGGRDPILSDKDRGLPPFSDLEHCF